MKTCSECQNKIVEKTAQTPEGITYKYFKCIKCGEEIVNMNQLHNLAESYRFMKKYNVKLSRWGLSIGLRIPQALVKKYNFRENEEVMLIPDEKGIKIISS